MKTLLIWPPGMKSENGTIFPMALGYLKNVIDCSVLDLALNPLSTEELREQLIGYELIAISVWGFNIQPVEDLIHFIRQHSTAKIVVGGPSAHMAKADYTIVGEGERTLQKLHEALAGNDLDCLEEVPGLAVGEAPCPCPVQFSDNLDDFGLVDYQKLQLDHYLETGYKDWMYTLKDKFRSAPIMATRGCPYDCSYCSGPVIMGKKVRKHSIKYVLETIERLYQKHAIRQISFLDDNLTFHAEYAKPLCEAIVRWQEKKGYQLVFTSLNGVRVNRLDEELVALMKRAGWGEIVIAPESGSPATLKRMRKRIDLADVQDKIALIHKHRMNVAAYFLLGYPGETREDLALTRDYILGSEIDRCIINFFNPIPGTPIYDQLEQRGELGKAPGKINYKQIGYITPELTKEDLQQTMDAIREKTLFREKWLKDL